MPVDRQTPLPRHGPSVSELRAANQRLVRRMARMERALIPLRDAETLFKALASNAFYGLVLSQRVNNKPATLYVNRKLCRMTGYSLAEIKRIDPSVFFRPKDLKLMQRRWRTRISGIRPVDHYEAVLVRKNKALLPVEVMGISITWRGKPTDLIIFYDLSAVKKSEKALRLSEEKFAKAFIASPNMMVVSTIEEGCVLDVNLAAQRLSGYTRRELIGQRMAELKIWRHMADRRRMLRMLRHTGSVRDIEFEFQNKAGKPVWVSFSAQPIEVQNKRCLLSILRDITIERRLKESLKASEAKFAKAFMASPDMICISTLPDRIVIDANDSYHRILGYARDDLIGRRPNDLKIWRCFGDRRRILRELRRHGTVRDMEFQWRHRSGALVWISLSADIIEIDHRPYSLSVARDMTDRHRAEEALRFSEERNRLIVNNTSDFVVELDLNGFYLSATPAVTKAFGLKPDEIIGQHFMILVHPDDRALAAERWATVSKRRQRTNIELRMRHRNGTWRWIAAHAFFYSPSGGASRIMAVARDVTVQRSATEALRRSEEKFIKIFRSSPDMITITTLKDGRFLDANSAVERALGYRYREMIGKRPETLAIWANPEERRQMQSLLLGKGSVHDFHVQYRRRDGTLFWVSISADLITIDNQSCILSVIRDITDRKRLSIERQRLTARIQEAQENERQNISTMLHDHLGQLLTTAKMETHSIRPSDDDSRRRQADAAKHIREALTSIRTMAMMLRTPILDDLGLAMAMKALVGDVAHAYHLRATLTHRGQLPVLGMPQQVCLYRVLQEALTNAARHSGSKRIWVTLKADATKVSVQVKDNGCGFNPAHVQTNRGLGLAGMRERLAQCGGYLNIASRPHQGTVLTAVCPCRLPPTELLHD